MQLHSLCVAVVFLCISTCEMCISRHCTEHVCSVFPCNLQDLHGFILYFISIVVNMVMGKISVSMLLSDLNLCFMM